GRPGLRHGARPHRHAGQRRGAAGRPRSTPRLPRRLNVAEALSQEHHQDRDSPTPKPGSYQTVGAPAPGAKVFWLDSPFAPRAVLLHPNRDSPASKPGFFSNRRSTRPGCEGVLVRLPFAPRAVLLHLNRDSPASKPGFFSNRRSTRPGCEGVLA